MPRVDYSKEFKALLEPHQQAGTSVSAAELFSHSELGDASDTTKVRQLKNFLSRETAFVGTVRGVLPSVKAIVELAEKTLREPIAESNVVDANLVCKEIVLRAAAPVLEEFVRTSLGEHITNDLLSVAVKDLIEFLAGDFASFARGSGNSLVSIAGSVNERLLIACLTERGLKGGDFTHTGTDSEGDLVIHSQAGAKTNLNVEIKSYHARERLLRGLQDIDRPKVGVGYFIDASEFNPSRTKTLLQTQAAAIYMPEGTLNDVSAEARALPTNDAIAFGSLFYRPLERFASDMLHFVNTGELPKVKVGP